MLSLIELCVIMLSFINLITILLSVRASLIQQVYDSMVTGFPDNTRLDDNIPRKGGGGSSSI